MKNNLNYFVQIFFNDVKDILKNLMLYGMKYSQLLFLKTFVKDMDPIVKNVTSTTLLTHGQR